MLKQIPSTTEGDIEYIIISGYRAIEQHNFKGIEEFINQLSKKEKNKGMSDDELNKYINEVKKYCGSFKEWFVNKKGRNE